jgi:hypothetical protein
MSGPLPMSMLLAAAAAVTAVQAHAAERPIPRLEQAGGHARLIVDGAPFLMLGAQAHNSSASDPAALARFFAGVKALSANTAEAPVYWELVEPEPGRFDFRSVDALLGQAREAGVRLVVLWFASWKNGESHYAPAWVKRDRASFRRVLGPGGDERDILSPTCAAARDADARAFAALMSHLRSVDAERTVVLVQVENETGLLGAERDRSPEAERLFAAAVPSELTSHITAHRDTLTPALAAAWAAAGGRSGGSWSEVFGGLADEAFSAWHVARYVDTVVAAGKQAYPLPMYVNAWLVNPGDERAGRWPSGGPTEHVLDVWKAAAPHVDLLAPDIYQPKVEAIAAVYARPDNPLFVPEIALRAHHAAYAFPILGRFDGLGVAPFGVEADGSGEERSGSERGEAAALAEFARSFRVLRPLLPLIARRQGSGQLRALVQDLDPQQVLRVGPRLALVASFPRPFSPDGPLGRALAIALAPDELVVAGVDVELVVRDLVAPLADPHQWARRQPILSIDEGTFEGERWVAGRRLNGDERWLRFGPEGGILRVKLDLR